MIYYAVEVDRDLSEGPHDEAFMPCGIVEPGEPFFDWAALVWWCSVEFQIKFLYVVSRYSFVISVWRFCAAKPGWLSLIQFESHLVFCVPDIFMSCRYSINFGTYCELDAPCVNMDFLL